MNQKSFPILAVICMVIAIIAIFISVKAMQSPNISLGSETFSGGVTNTSATVATSSTIILSANRTRQYAIMCNNDGTNFVDMAFHASVATSTTGIKLEAGECYEIDADNLYVGAVYGIADTASVVITTLEK